MKSRCLTIFPALSAAAARPVPPAKGVTATEEAASYQLPDGYHFQWVLSEPEIKEPVVTVFDGDGVYEKHNVFVDHLLLPRMNLPLDHGKIVIHETDSLDPYLHTGTDGDGGSDKKEPR